MFRSAKRKITHSNSFIVEAMSLWKEQVVTAFNRLRQAEDLISSSNALLTGAPAMAKVKAEIAVGRLVTSKVTLNAAQAIVKELVDQSSLISGVEAVLRTENGRIYKAKVLEALAECRASFGLRETRRIFCDALGFTSLKKLGHDVSFHLDECNHHGLCLLVMQGPEFGVNASELLFPVEELGEHLDELTLGFSAKQA